MTPELFRSRHYRDDQLFLVEWFGQKIDSTGFHGLHTGGDIAVATYNMNTIGRLFLRFANSSCTSNPVKSGICKSRTGRQGH